MLSAVVIAMLTQCSNFGSIRARRTCRKPMRSSEFEEHLGPSDRCFCVAKPLLFLFLLYCCAPCCATSGLPPRLSPPCFLPLSGISSSHLLLDSRRHRSPGESRQSCCFAGVPGARHAALVLCHSDPRPITTTREPGTTGPPSGCWSCSLRWRRGTAHVDERPAPPPHRLFT